jgi:DNA-binding CsgD family transcriptional regulator
VPLDVLAECDAVRLFVDRAMKSRPDFALSDANATAVAEICRRLDGIPLAIELAAARIRALAPDQVAHGLDDRFRLLTGGSRSVLPRQQTLRASVDWSHHLLSPAEQALFRRLSVFAGTFTLDATTAICSDDSVDDGEVLDLLTQLVDRSLVQIDDIGVEVRYRLLETIKQYGREQLERADETTATRDRHLEWYAAVADRARPALLTSDQPACLARLETDHDNLRGALEWAATSFAVEKLLRMAVDLTFLWFFGGHFREGTGWLEQALTESGPDISLMRARARWGTAYLNFYAGNALTAVDLAQEALAWGEAAGDDLTMARALDTLGSLQQLSDPVAAFTVLQEAEARARAGDDEWCLTDCLQKQAWCFIFRDRYEELGALLDESSALVRRLGYPFFVAYDSIAITWMGVRRGLIADARAAAVDARAAAELSREPLTVAFCAWLHAETELLGGNHAAARDIVDGCRSEMVRRGAQPFTLMVVEFGVARVQIAIGELSPATQDLEEIAAAYATEQILLGLGLILPTLAEALLLDGKFERARSHLIRVLDVAHTLDSPAMLGWAHHLLAAADREGGDHEAAEGHAHEALALFSDHGFRPDSVETLELLAALAADDESWAEAARLLAAADAIRAEHGWVRWPIRQPRVDQTMTKVGAALSVDERAAATADGATLSLDAAIAYARRARGSRGRPSSGWGSLTPTELEVVKLVAAGLTNPQIGERLFIARGTVKIHLSHVFTKLGIGSRAELAAEVTRRGM